ncbi:Synaptic vesicle glycoprotein 2B [Frankliniella fusca]|uniref:Synaptic vesicle glycoprotein 2B n=1 Tax=Frankliniella fusca TaxID=407009 RepID=A0AAE1LKY7_9NEOP|nr:Synaptic vesicle glycoprotein 2B [Frankliniella fusca]
MKVTAVHHKEDGAKFSEAIAAAGHGKYQYLAFITAGLVYFTSGMESGINAYILPSVKCAFQLSDSQMGILNALFLGGGALAAHLWGSLSDAYGRRPVLVATALLDAVCIVASMFATSYYVFAVLRLCAGMLNMAPAGLSFLYLGEFICDKRRSSYAQAMGTMWIASWILLPGLAWLIIPLPWSLDVLGVRLESWRLFMGLLLAAGREEDALRVYRRIYATNTGDVADNYPVKRLRLPAAAAPSSSASSAHGQGVLHVLARTMRLSSELVRPPVLYRTALCCVIYFCSMFVMYGFGYWLPELLSRFQLHANAHPDERTYVCEVLAAQQPRYNASASPLEDLNCGGAAVVDPSAFLNTAIVNCASMGINLISTISTGFVGRRTLSAVANLLAGLSGFGLFWASATMEVVAVAIFFNAMAETGCIGINTMVVDIFPPRVSGVGVASVMLSGRLGGSVGNLAMGYLLERSCELPLSLLFSTAILCGVLCCCAHRRYAEDDKLPSVLDQAKTGKNKEDIVAVFNKGPTTAASPEAVPVVP